MLRKCVFLNKNRLKPKNRICQNVFFRFRAFTDAKELMTSSKSKSFAKSFSIDNNDKEDSLRTAFPETL